MKLQIGIDSPKKFEVEDLLNFLGEELKIKDNVELIVAYNNSLLNRLSTEDIEYKALLHSPLPNYYVLYVKENVYNLHYILCHELVHLEQYERGDLKISNDFSTVTWKGVTYTKEYPYTDREWEDEAFRLETKLWKKFKKKLKQDQNERD